MLSRLNGRDVRGRDGRLLGRLADLTVSLADESTPTMVDRILVRGARNLLVPWSEVASLHQSSIELASEGAGFEVTSISDALDDDEILLVRDVLDTQIVDIVGQRVARVADVVLARTPDGRIEVVGVHVGFSAVLRRLGLGRLAARVRNDAVAWTDLHLTSDRGHAVQLATPRSAVHLLDARGLAMLVSRLDTESATEVLAAKGPEVAADVIRASHPVVAERVLRAMTETDAAHVVAAMPADHATHWRGRLGTPGLLRGRRLLRFHVWPRHRHSPRGDRE